MSQETGRYEPFIRQFGRLFDTLISANPDTKSSDLMACAVTALALRAQACGGNPDRFSELALDTSQQIFEWAAQSGRTVLEWGVLQGLISPQESADSALAARKRAADA